MSVNTGHAKIRRAAEALRGQWSRVAISWRDENSRHFEDHCLKPLLAALRSAEKAMGYMDDVLYRMHRDCDDESS